MEKTLIKTMNEWEEKVDGRLASLTSSINLNTDHKVETTNGILKHQATNIHTIVSSTAMEFQRSNQRMPYIVNNLDASLPHLYQELPEGPSTSNQLMGAQTHLQAPPGFPQAPIP